jgi:hypothetical protein
VLDVLDPDALGPPHEDRVRIRRVDDALDLDAELLGLRNVLVSGVDEDGEVVEQWTLGLARIGGIEVDEGAADDDPRPTRRAGRRVALEGEQPAARQ